MRFSVRSFIFVMNMARRQASLAKAGDLATLETLIAVYYIYERSQKFDKRCLFSANYKSMPYQQNKYANVKIFSISLSFCILTNAKKEKKNHSDNSDRSFGLNATMYKVLENVGR